MHPLGLCSNEPLVAIFLCTYNGETYLEQQLVSIEQQTHSNWHLFVSDDGSTDATLEILLAFQGLWGPEKLTIRQGPKNGFSSNFLSLACDPTIRAGCYAFCDQDDVWAAPKLRVGVERLHRLGSQNSPLLYCGRTTYVRADLTPFSRSPLFKRPPCFRNALVQSLAGGNTMLFSRGLKRLLEFTSIRSAPSHDWWLYQLVTGAGGSVFYDETPQILYRQHNQALIGGNTSLMSRFLRFYYLCRGVFKRWTHCNLQNLRQARECLTDDANNLVSRFLAMRSMGVVARLREFQALGLYRQTTLGQLGLWFAVFFKRL